MKRRLKITKDIVGRWIVVHLRRCWFQKLYSHRYYKWGRINSSTRLRVYAPFDEESSTISVKQIVEINDYLKVK